MNAPASRRGFLTGLTTLPLIGGSVALIGSPTAAAVPVTGGTIATYLAWLHFEQRYLAWGANCKGWLPMMNPGACFHGRSRLDPEASALAAIQRAPVMLAAAGCRLTSLEAEDQCGERLGPAHWIKGVRCA